MPRRPVKLKEGEFPCPNPNCKMTCKGGDTTKHYNRSPVCLELHHERRRAELLSARKPPVVGLVDVHPKPLTDQEIAAEGVSVAAVAALESITGHQVREAD